MATQSIIETRGAQMFPTLIPAEMARLKRFGAPRHYRQGEAVARVGQAGLGLTLFLKGEVEISQRIGGEHSHIVTHGPGSFMGELAQLSGAPSLVDADALTAVEAIAIPPERLRALLDRRGRAWRADHAGLDPAAGRADRDRRRRADHRRHRQ